MNEKIRKSGYWTWEECKKEALKFESKGEWVKNSKGGYGKSSKRGWLNECTAHMTEKKKKNGYWTIEKCRQDALKYRTRNEWNVESSSAYQAAAKNGWLEKCCKHMELKRIGQWTKENCQKDALKCKTRSEWITKSKSAYNKALKNGWLDECCKHMIRVKRKNSKPGDS